MPAKQDHILDWQSYTSVLQKTYWSQSFVRCKWVMWHEICFNMTYCTDLYLIWFWIYCVKHVQNTYVQYWLEMVIMMAQDIQSQNGTFQVISCPNQGGGDTIRYYLSIYQYYKIVLVISCKKINYIVSKGLIYHHFGQALELQMAKELKLDYRQMHRRTNDKRSYLRDEKKFF